MKGQGPRETLTLSVLGQRNTALKNRGQETHDAHEEGNMIRDKRKERQDFKIKQEMQDMTVIMQQSPTRIIHHKYFMIYDISTLI